MFGTPLNAAERTREGQISSTLITDSDFLTMNQSNVTVQERKWDCQMFFFFFFLLEFFLLYAEDDKIATKTYRVL